MGEPVFEWDEEKDSLNQQKHGISFHEARKAFEDPNRLIIYDLEHSQVEQRFFCVGKIERGIVTVRYTERAHRIRIYGAGFWREGKKRYEQKYGPSTR